MIERKKERKISSIFAYASKNYVYSEISLQLLLSWSL